MWQHHIPPEHFFWRLEIIARPWPCWQQDFLLLICPVIYPEIYHILQCLFVRGFNKKQRRGRIISNFTKRFFISYDDQRPGAYGANFTMWLPLLAPSKKGLHLPFSFSKKRKYSIKIRVYYFILKIATMFPLLTSRNSMINT